ncbi:MAG: hypothetical protein ACRCT1_22665 [Microcoleaceae cyanobacterium]
MGLLPKRENQENQLNEIPGLLYQGFHSLPTSMKDAISIYQANSGSVLCEYAPNVASLNKWYWIVLENEEAYLNLENEGKDKIKKYNLDFQGE